MTAPEREEFEKFYKDVLCFENGRPKEILSVYETANLSWQARRPEIDALNQKIQEISIDALEREGIIDDLALQKGILKAEIGRLGDEVERLRKDAERYRWLCDQDSESGIQILLVGIWVKPAMCTALTFQEGKESIDDSIDFAMADKGE